MGDWVMWHVGFSGGLRTGRTGGQSRRAEPAHPLRVGAREVGVEADHLGCNPEPELHPQFMHARDQRPKPSGQRVASGVQSPSSRAPGEPAVITHESFHPDARTCLGEFDERLKIVVKTDGLPAVPGGESSLPDPAVHPVELVETARHVDRDPPPNRRRTPKARYGSHRRPGRRRRVRCPRRRR